MFQVERFGGFSNPSHSNGKSRIDSLLERVRNVRAEESSDSERMQSVSNFSSTKRKLEASTDQPAVGENVPQSTKHRKNEKDKAELTQKTDYTSIVADGKKQKFTEKLKPALSSRSAPAPTLQIAKEMMQKSTKQQNMLKKGVFSISQSVQSEAEKLQEVDHSLKPQNPKNLLDTQNKVWDCLHPHLQDAARKKGLKWWFPIQVQSIPSIIHRLTPPGDKTFGGDFCIAAPTGSGKTLSYVIPVLQALIGRRVVRLRALVILPTRDLAVQVHGVFKSWAQSTGLKIGLVRGQAWVFLMHLLDCLQSYCVHVA